MATIKLDREEQPDFDEAMDVSYEDEGQPDFDDGGQPDYEESFQEEEMADEGNQEWRGSKKR
jgi:hypothetical protein